MHSIAIVGLAAALVATTAFEARADDSPPEDPWRARPLGVVAQGTAFGGPLGLGGIAVDVAVIPPLSVEAGAGFGLSGKELAAGLRLRTIRVGTNSRLAFGLGVSGGPYSNWLEHISSEGYDNAVFDWLVYTNTEVSIDVRLDNGFSVRPFIGVEWLVYHSPARCTVGSDSGTKGGPDVPCSKAAVGDEFKDGSPLPRLPYIGVSVGYAIGLP